MLSAPIVQCILLMTSALRITERCHVTLGCAKSEKPQSLSIGSHSSLVTLIFATD